ncbi:protein kinase domain-containing protein [Nocardia sp. NPDC004722]
MRFQPGTVFAGYKIERVLAIGGMGAVYLARHPRLPRQVALKVLLDDTQADPTLATEDKIAARLELRRRFAREAELIASLEHPNIIRIEDFSGPDNDVLWISMRYVAGGDAADLLTREGGRLPADRAVRLIAQAARGLDHAHGNRVVHRDVKPLNLLIDRDGQDERVVVTDFGIARPLDATLTARAAPLTYAYAAPERFDPRAAVDHRADVYSLGCTLYEFITGRKPFPAADIAAVMGAHLFSTPPRPSQVVYALPTDFDDVIAKALAKQPGDRFGTCSELVADAVAALGGRSRSLARTSRPRTTPYRASSKAADPKQLLPDVPKAGKPLGDFLIRRQLSEGQGWSVYSAWDRNRNDTIALKIRNASNPPTAESRTRFLAELARATGLEHENIVKIHGHSSATDAVLWVSTQLIEGGDTLQALLDNEPGPLPPRRAVRLTAQLADGLDHAHRSGVAHGRVDPSNVLLSRDNEAERAMLTNFGGNLVPELTGADFPRMYWLAPEQILGDRVDPRTDVYHLGCTLYRLLSGIPPFGDNRVAAVMKGHLYDPPPKPSDNVPGLPELFDAIIAKALAKDPGDRYGTCGQLSTAAEQALSQRYPFQQIPPQQPLPQGLALRYQARSDRGLVASNNEDSVYAGAHLLAVADGAGAAPAGEVASQLMIATLARLDGEDPGADPVAKLRQAVREGNTAIAALTAEQRELAGMGTTLTAMLFTGQSIGLAYIGNSHGYRLRNGKLTRITMRGDPSRILNGRRTEMIVANHTPHAGDRYLLCTDGLSDVVSEEAIADVLRANVTPSERADRLIELALRHGGPGNVTLIVADVVSIG